MSFFDWCLKRGNTCTIHTSICILLIKFAIILCKICAIVAMTTVLLRHPIFIQCWCNHRNRAPWQQNSFTLKKKAMHIKHWYVYSCIWVMMLYWTSMLFCIQWKRSNIKFNVMMFHDALKWCSQTLLTLPLQKNILPLSFTTEHWMFQELLYRDRLFNICIVFKFSDFIRSLF